MNVICFGILEPYNVFVRGATIVSVETTTVVYVVHLLGPVTIDRLMFSKNALKNCNYKNDILILYHAFDTILFILQHSINIPYCDRFYSKRFTFLQSTEK